MIFTPVKELPKPRKRTRCNRSAERLHEFLSMNVKYARMDVGKLEYSHSYSAYTSMRNMVKFYSLPIDVKMLNGEVYLINLLLEE